MNGIQLRKEHRTNTLKTNKHMKLAARYQICFHQLEDLKALRNSEGLQAAIDALQDDYDKLRATPLTQEPV